MTYTLPAGSHTYDLTSAAPEPWQVHASDGGRPCHPTLPYQWQLLLCAIPVTSPGLPSYLCGLSSCSPSTSPLISARPERSSSHPCDLCLTPVLADCSQPPGARGHGHRGRERDLGRARGRHGVTL